VKAIAAGDAVRILLSGSPFTFVPK
jgi:hypothetical protein